MRVHYGRVGGAIILGGCLLLLLAIPAGATASTLSHAAPLSEPGILVLSAGLLGIAAGAAVLGVTGPGPLRPTGALVGLVVLAIGLAGIAISELIPIPSGTNTLQSIPYLIAWGIGVLGVVGGALLTAVTLLRQPGAPRLAGALILIALAWPRVVSVVLAAAVLAVLAIRTGKVPGDLPAG